MGVQPILPVKVPITIDTVLNGDFDGHCDGDITCKQTSRQNCAGDFQMARSLF